MLLDETGSTNAVAKKLAEDGAVHGTTVFTTHQTAGRGRLGRVWLRPEGTQLALSIVLRPQLSPAVLPLVCLGAGAAICAAAPVDIRIKWPNDLMTPDGQKLGGLLAEAEFKKGRVAWLVLGVGVNIQSAPDCVPNTACLADIGFDQRSWADFAIRLVRAVLAMSDELEHSPQSVLDQWRRYSATLGNRVEVNGITGMAADIDESGAIIVVDDDETSHRILAGDVTMIASNRE